MQKNKLNLDFNNEAEDRILGFVQTQFGHEVFTPGLERTKSLYQTLIEEVTKRKIKIITVAGTNGKGQTCHTICHYLNHFNKNSALWTSPHILSIRERFNYNGIDINYKDLEELILISASEVKKIDVQISFYEFLFYVFLRWSLTKNLDYLILEVGLGGKLDAVNHFDCDIAIVTSISRDHQLILGSTYSKILTEKLGITRPLRPLITSFKLNYLKEFTQNYCTDNNIPYMNIKVGSDYSESNRLLAQIVIEKLGHKTLTLPIVPKYKGREEIIQWSGIELLFIGAHNPDGMRECLNYVKLQNLNINYVLFSFSKRDIEDIDSMLKTLIQNINSRSELVATIFSHPKAVSMTILEDVLSRAGHNRIKFISDWKSFLNGIKEPQNFVQKSPQSIKVLVLGSYYFIGEIQRYLFTNK